MVTYHCTVLHGFNRVSRRRCETQAGTFTCLRLKQNKAAYFFKKMFFFLRSENAHRKRILGRQEAKSSQRTLRVFLFFFFFSFLIFLPLRVRLLDRFLVAELNAVQKRQSFWNWARLRLYFLCLPECRRCCSRRFGIGVLVSDWLRRCWPSARAAPRPAPLTSLPPHRRARAVCVRTRSTQRIPSDSSLF